MNRLVVCAFAVLAVGACSSDSDNGTSAGIGTFDSAVVTIDSTSLSLHVIRNPADTFPPSDTTHHESFFVGDDSVAQDPTVTIEPQGTVVPNGANNIAASFSVPGIVDFNDSGFLQADSTGSTVLTYTFTDFNHQNATSSVSVPITVTVGPPSHPRRVH